MILQIAFLAYWTLCFAQLSQYYGRNLIAAPCRSLP